ncbi:MAG: type II toxin-antitoxin system RelE/ParE family toxin [Elusimicrobiota bacterium]
MSYRLSIKRSAEKEMDRIPSHIHKKISDRIGSLAIDPFPVGCKKLQSSNDAFRIRIGDYRVLYTVDRANNVVEVYAAGHRRDVYR